MRTWQPSSTRKPQESRDPKEKPAPVALGDPQANQAVTVSQDSPDFPAPLAPQALLDPLALAETLLPRCPMAMTRNPEACPCLALWVLLVLEVSLAPLVHLVPKVSKAPLVSPASLELQVPWVLVVLLAPLARMEMMVNLANLVALESVAPLDLRVLEVYLEQLVSLE